MSLQCSQCSKSIPEGKKFCPYCGSKIQTEKQKDFNCSCGKELNPEKKFCASCGAKNPLFVQPSVQLKSEPSPTPAESPKQCSCGADHPKTGKFCIQCGKPLLPINESSPIPTNTIHQPISATQNSVHVQKHDPLPEPSVKAVPTKRKQKNKGLRWAASILLIIGIGVGGYFGYDYFFGGIKKKLLIEQKIVPSEEDQTVSYKNDISVTVPFGLIDSEETLSISSVKGLPNAEGLKMFEAYDVSISNVTTLDGYIEITMKYDPSKIPTGMSPSRALTCMYYNEVSAMWEPAPFMINESLQQITVYTPHLSIFAYGAAESKIEPGPMMKIASVPFPAGEMLDEKKVIETLSMYSSSGDGSASGKGYIAGWEFVTEWFGITAQVSTFAENALEVGALQGCNQIATEIGIGFALVQAAIDYSNGKQDKAVLELTKNLGNYAILKIFNTAAINVAFVGVFAIDYSLNKFATTAISQKNQIYIDAYQLYYKEKRQKEKINTIWWYKKLKGLARKSKSPTESGDIVQKFLHDYVWEFWNDETTVAAYMDRITSGHGFTGGGGLNEKLKTDISNNHLSEIVHVLNETGIFERIIKELRIEAQSKLWDQLNLMKDKLNIIYNINVIVKLDPECEDYKEISVSGLNIRFVTSNPAHKDLWKGKSDSSGEMFFQCTALGYVDAGCPTTVEVEVPSPTAGGEPEIFSGEMKLGSSGKTTVVEIIIGSPKLEGTWKLDATCTFAKLDASLQYMDGMADLYGSGDEYRKVRAETTESMKGQKGQFPDLVMDGMEYIWKVTRENGFIVITSPGFEDKKGLGGTQYRIKFQGPKKFTGTIETRGYLGDKENIMKFDVIGTRIK